MNYTIKCDFSNCKPPCKNKNIQIYSKLKLYAVSTKQQSYRYIKHNILLTPSKSSNKKIFTLHNSKPGINSQRLNIWRSFNVQNKKYCLYIAVIYKTPTKRMQPDRKAQSFILIGFVTKNMINVASADRERYKTSLRMY